MTIKQNILANEWKKMKYLKQTCVDSWSNPNDELTKKKDFVKKIVSVEKNHREKINVMSLLKITLLL